MSGESWPGGALFNFVRDPEVSPSLMDLDRDRIPFFGLTLLRFEESACGSEESLELPDPVRWSKRTTSERLSAVISEGRFV